MISTDARKCGTFQIIYDIEFKSLSSEVPVIDKTYFA